MKRHRAWVMNGLLICVSLLAALAVTEVVVRVFAPQPTGITYQDRYGLPMHWPGITRYLSQYGHDVTFNSVGMRDREHPVAKPPGVFRILLLGDSFTEALQVPFEASLPSLLEALGTKESGRPVEVINAGVSGWGTDDELRYLSTYGLKYQPDLVVVAMTLHNDISDNLRQEWHRIRGGELVDQPREPARFLDYKITQLKAYLSTRLQTYQLWRRVRHGSEIRQVGRQLNAHVVQLFETPPPPSIVNGVELTGLLLRRLQAVAQASGGRVALVLLPLRYQLTDSTFAEFVRHSGVPPVRMNIREPQNLIRPIADSLGMPVIDLLPAFRAWAAESSAPLFLEWDGHWNEAGHRLAADALVDGLLSTGSLR
jgi:lysophospholipase L1-like esterase